MTGSAQHASYAFLNVITRRRNGMREQNQFDHESFEVH